MGPAGPPNFMKTRAGDVAQALLPAAPRLFGTLLAASRAGAREGFSRLKAGSPKAGAAEVRPTRIQ